MLRGALLSSNATCWRSCGPPNHGAWPTSRRHDKPPSWCPPKKAWSLALVPQRDHVVVAVDLRQPGEVLQSLLLHALAHLACCHVRPGDRWGHWDTRATAASEQPHRHWDRDAHAHVARHLKRPVRRQINVLDDCTPTEKAQLGLWLMAGEMLGEKRQLHPAAERYQEAAYQRQAAERVAAMLEQYGGAMLCDGVGLGKTYVATTVIVHYANTWRDQWAATPERLVEDPFRVTILAPNSVVSTWRREALPTLAAFGVPLAAVRVVSHTKLSRIAKTSGVLEATRGRQSDFEHLLLSDLVIVDEAHNFRSLAARRTKVLRDLLRVQPRLHSRRRVALLTATPVNNSLEDLRQEASLLFCKPLFLSNAKTADGYRRQAVKSVRDRCKRARGAPGHSDVAGLLIHGQPDAKFSDTIEFREDLDFGSNVQRIGDYIKEQDKRLKDLQARLRDAAHDGGTPDQAAAHVRIAEDLLDRVVVQRSRSLCKEIERQQRLQRRSFCSAQTPQLPRSFATPMSTMASTMCLRVFFRCSTATPRSEARRSSLSASRSTCGTTSAKASRARRGLIGRRLAASPRAQAAGELARSPSSSLCSGSPCSMPIVSSSSAGLCRDARRTQDEEAPRVEIADRPGKPGRRTSSKIRRARHRRAPRAAAADFLERLSAAPQRDRPAADTDDPLPPQLGTCSARGRAETQDARAARSPLGSRASTWSRTSTPCSRLTRPRRHRLRQVRPQRVAATFIAGGEGRLADAPPRGGSASSPTPRSAGSSAACCRHAAVGRRSSSFPSSATRIAYVRSVLGAARAFKRNDWSMPCAGLGVARSHAARKSSLLSRRHRGHHRGDRRSRRRRQRLRALLPHRPVAAGHGARPPRPSARLLTGSWETAWPSAWHAADRRSPLHRRPGRGREPPGRRAAGQLRRPLEPGAHDPALRPYRPPSQPPHRAAARASPIWPRSRASWARPSPATTGTTIRTRPRSRST